MRLSRSAKVVLGIVTALVLLFIYTPLLLVVVNSFNADRTFGWPPQGFTLEWWGKAFDSPGVREAVVSSFWVAVAATLISLLLGTLLALSLQRYSFFGRDVISLLVILPIALAGGLLAFALSFDEIIVTTFTIGAGETTLPIWILQNLFRPNQSPVVNVVAVVLIVVSIVPIWLAQRLAGDAVGVGGARAKADQG